MLDGDAVESFGEAVGPKTSFAAIVSTSPAWASEVTSHTPARPRATGWTTTEFHEAVVSLVATTARIDKFNSFALRRF